MHNRLKNKTNSCSSAVVRKTIYCRSTWAAQVAAHLRWWCSPLRLSCNYFLCPGNPAKWRKTQLFITTLTLTSIALQCFDPAFTPLCIINSADCKWTTACAQNYQDPTGRQTDRLSQLTRLKSGMHLTKETTDFSFQFLIALIAIFTLKRHFYHTVVVKEESKAQKNTENK